MKRRAMICVNGDKMTFTILTGKEKTVIHDLALYDERQIIPQEDRFIQIMLNALMIDVV